MIMSEPEISRSGRASASVDHTVVVFSIDRLGAEIWLATADASPALQAAA